MNCAEWIPDNCTTSSVTYEQIMKESALYKQKKSIERQYYMSGFLEIYPKSPVLHTGESNLLGVENCVKLYFDGHNVWYHWDPENKVIYQHGYGVLGTYQYLNGTAEYQYILDCCNQQKPIDKSILLDHLFNENGMYIG